MLCKYIKQNIYIYFDFVFITIFILNFDKI